MKNNIRRGFSVLIALAMLCGMALPALAENKKETVFVIADAEGNAQSGDRQRTVAQPRQAE